MKYTQLIIIAILIGYIVFLKECQPEIDPQVVKVETHTTDTIHHRDTTYVPTPVPEPYVVHDTVYDTTYIVKDYNTMFRYDDVILNDSTGIIIITDWILHNRIYKRSKSIKLFSNTKYLTSYITVPEPKKWHIYAGGGVSGNRSTFGFDVGVGLMTRKGTMYSFSYDIVQADYRLGVMFRIK